ncbi:MAG: hypothetical protein J6K33_07315, partial [Alistipes sp.]|nr:hypothetical protein [Alistipes sp.]
STAKVINHIDSAATITGGVESSIVGYDGVTTAIYLDGASSTAKFSAKDVIGKAKVAIYVVGAEGKDASVAADAQVAVSHKSGITDKKPDTSRTVGGWIELDTYDFSGSDDEYVEIKGQDGAHVYIDSVKFVYVDEYLFSEPVISTDGKFSVTYDCYKQTDDDTTIAAIAAKYTGDVMNGASVNRLTHTDKGIYKITTNAFDITAGASYKAFIWDSTDNATPLAGAVVYPEAE